MIAEGIGEVDRQSLETGRDDERKWKNLEERVNRLEKMFLPTDEGIYTRVSRLEELLNRLNGDFLSFGSTLTQTIEKVDKFQQEEKIENLIKDDHLRANFQGIDIKTKQNALQYRLEEEKRKEMREEKIKFESPKKIQNIKVDTGSPFAKNFRVQGNKITLQSQVDRWHNLQRKLEWQQVLLDAVLEDKFSFGAHITSRQAMIGVVDRNREFRSQTSHASGNAICYVPAGTIYYGHHRQCKEQKTDDELHGGMDVWVEVDLRQCRVTFTLEGKGKKWNSKEGKFESTQGRRQYTVHSDLLQEPGVQLVPYFEMIRRGDSVSYTLT